MDLITSKEKCLMKLINLLTYQERENENEKI